MFTEALAEALRENCLGMNLTTSENFTQGVKSLTVDYIEKVQRSRLPGRRFAKIVKLDPETHARMKELAEDLKVSMSDVGEACIRSLNDSLQHDGPQSNEISQPLIEHLSTKSLIVELERRGFNVSPKNTR